eukprot:760946-Hanusia_phi.AAC.2
MDMKPAVRLQRRGVGWMLHKGVGVEGRPREFESDCPLNCPLPSEDMTPDHPTPSSKAYPHPLSLWQVNRSRIAPLILPWHPHPTQTSLTSSTHFAHATGPQL